jgi:hypothetical protein
MVITQGGGTMLLRTDNDTAIYKMVSIREIDAAAANLSGSPQTIRPTYDRLHVRRNGSGYTITIGEPCRNATAYALFDPTGRSISRGMIPAGETSLSLAPMSVGFHLLCIGAGREVKMIKSVWY